MEYRDKLNSGSMFLAILSSIDFARLTCLDTGPLLAYSARARFTFQ